MTSCVSPDNDSASFDVFLSYNTEDRARVVDVAERLRSRGLRVWLDVWEIRPGRPFQEALEQIITSTKAAAIFIGASGLGPWERPEMHACLNECVKRHLPVIPVLLPQANDQPELPLFLQAFNWVDLRTGTIEAGIARLVWGITGQTLTDSAELPARAGLAPWRAVGVFVAPAVLAAVLLCVHSWLAFALAAAALVAGLGCSLATKLGIARACPFLQPPRRTVTLCRWAGLLVATAVALVAVRQLLPYRPSAAERAAFDEIRERGGEVQPGGSGRAAALLLSAGAVTDADLHRWLAASETSELKILDLSNASITNDALADVGNIRGLERLTLSQCSGLNASGLQHLAALTALRVLDLDLGGWDPETGSPVPCGVEDGLQYLANLTALEEVDLSFTDFGGAGGGSSWLLRLPQLKVLRLAHTSLTDKDLVVLLGLRGLTTLDLTGNEIMDRELKTIGRMTALTELILRQTKITKDGLLSLEDLTSLERLDLSLIKGLKPGDEQPLRVRLEQKTRRVIRIDI